MEFGLHDWYCQEPDGATRTGSPAPRALIAGSFNPLHAGHRQLAAIAEHRLGLPVAYELSRVNVDKPPLADEEVRRRLAEFVGVSPIYVTRAPTFERKASLFPGAVMIVGCDTAERILDPRYYQSLADRQRSLTILGDQGTKFLVAGRVNRDGRFVGLEHVHIDAEFRHLFEAIPESDYRVDLSSSQIRQGQAGQ